MTFGFLLDTNVISATAPDRQSVPDAAKAAARAWIVANQAQLFLPVIAIAEVAAGIGAREGSGATRHAGELAVWLRAVLGDYSERVFVFDTRAALWARGLTQRAREGGTVVGFADLTVACIAQANDLVVATRNVRDFAPMGVATFDPFTV